MKVSKDIGIVLTEEELSRIVLNHLRKEGELPEMEGTSFDKVRTQIRYRDDELYEFRVTLEKGSVDE